ncbi:MAG: hypothetical protein ACHQ0J_08010 [Candidatus Dormibacterales bacterium]
MSISVFGAVAAVIGFALAANFGTLADRAAGLNRRLGGTAMNSQPDFWRFNGALFAIGGVSLAVWFPLVQTLRQLVGNDHRITNWADVGVAWMVFGLVGAAWHSWHVVSGSSLPGFMGYRYRRRGMNARGLRLYCSLQLVATIGVFIGGLGLVFGSLLAIGVGALAILLGAAVELVAFAPWSGRQGA